jgi:hypothetical protein
VTNHRLYFATLALLAGSPFAGAHAFDPGGKVIVACRAGKAPRTADIAHAIESSHYWAAQETRREMLMLAERSCASGGTTVTFVPPPDQRYGTPADRQIAAKR